VKARLLFLFFIAAGCSSETTALQGSCQVNTPSKTEPSYCSNVIVPGDAVTISGTATFTKRNLIPSGLGGPAAPKAIRFAEVAVLDSGGNVLNCGTTDSNGDFSIDIERTNSNVYVEVRSRANNANLKASVLDNHTDVNYHAIQSTSVIGNTNQSVGTINAPHNGSLEGGAFNILDLIYEASSFLATETAGCSGSFADCVPVSVANKVTVFWQKGFNPATYYCADASDTVSFYVNGSSRLYIVGGVNGDVDSTDTDHFDDNIILHEYGHFLEDAYSISDSPGGTHNGNSLLDARLAWSEAWASYFAAKVSGVYVYQDTKGNTDGSTSNLIYYNMERNLPVRDPSPSAYTELDGEGSFREFAIARALVDATDTDASDFDNDGIEASFAEIWTILAGSNGFANSSLEHRFAGNFFQLHDNLAGRTDIKSLLDTEKIYDAVTSDFLDHYATPDAGDGCGDISISPGNGNDKAEDGSFANSNQFASNDFYLIDHAGGNLSVSMNHDGVQDLDIYLYGPDYTYGSASSVLAKSDSTSSTTESFSTNLSAGKYLLNVKVFPTFISGILKTSTAGYSVFVNSNKVCP